jgi:hypothetical protein
MERWDIDTYFSIGISMPEYTPSIADSLFVWPNFVDPAVFHDYGLQKIVPVMITGQAYNLYPWRQRIYKILADHYPSLICPQFSYESRSASRMLAGESYARALNASFTAPTCGTMGKELVRKHLEIPGSMTCLITEKTPALEAAGFRDMENCVFVDASNVTDKLDFLFENSEEMRRITEAGYNLVHTKHTLRHRPQLLQWLMLKKSLLPGQRIIQPSPFADLVAVDKLSGQKSSHVIGNGFDRILLREGDASFSKRDFHDAKQQYQKCLEYVTYLPEARYRLALCNLHEGNARAASDILRGMIEVTTEHYGARSPDPVEWAYFLISELCQGRVNETRDLYDHYSFLKHKELDYTRRALQIITKSTTEREDLSNGSVTNSRSIHQPPDLDFESWILQLSSILKVCKQDEIANLLCSQCTEHKASFGYSSAWFNRSKYLKRDFYGARVRLYKVIDAFVKFLNVPGLRPNVPPTPEFRYLNRISRRIARLVLRGRARRLSYRLEEMRFRWVRARPR